MIKNIVLAAGCFWGVQAALDKVPGIVATTVGYTGGRKKNPTYKEVCTDKTGHAESVLVKYDDTRITLSELLDFFFMIHDPTTLNRQGVDHGRQYRSAIFYNTLKERQLIKQKIKQFSLYFKDKIVTEVVKLKIFYPAETYHQKYFERHGETKNRTVEIAKEIFLQTKLTPEQYWIMRGKGTEPPFSGEYVFLDSEGTYRCAACGQKLFNSDNKFLSNCGWPSFDAALPESVRIRPDLSHFMIRDEVICSRCGSHLGHIFGDIGTKTGLRYCINSGALKFDKKKM